MLDMNLEDRETIQSSSDRKPQQEPIGGAAGEEEASQAVSDSGVVDGVGMRAMPNDERSYAAIQSYLRISFLVLSRQLKIHFLYATLAYLPDQ